MPKARTIYKSLLQGVRLNLAQDVRTFGTPFNVGPENFPMLTQEECEIVAINQKFVS